MTEPVHSAESVAPAWRDAATLCAARLARLEVAAAEVIASWDGLSQFTMAEAVEALQRALGGYGMIDGEARPNQGETE